MAAMDKADGSGTLLFDLAARNWSKDVLAKLDIPAAWLPPTFEGPEVTGKITAEAAAETGLAVGTPVTAGGGDQAAGAVGAGAVKPGVVALTLGTSGVVFASTDKPLVEPQGRLHAFCLALPATWHFMGVTLSAAGSLQWYHDTLAPDESFDALMAEAAREHRTLLEVSVGVGLAFFNAARHVGRQQVLEPYTEDLRPLRDEGFGAYAVRVSRPYAQAVARHWDPGTRTLTARGVERMRERRG
jgi:sugar (pentulose or hexulose) kinase